jgi:hypothetical protein
VVELSISGGNLRVHVQGADRLWAFKSSLEIPLEHVVGIRADPAIAQRLVARDQVAGNQHSWSNHGGHLLPGRETDPVGCSQPQQHSCG